MDVSKQVDAVREFWDTHKKFILALAAGLTAAIAVVGDGEFSLNDFVVIASALGFGPVAVERAKNHSEAIAKARTTGRRAKRLAG